MPLLWSTTAPVPLTWTPPWWIVFVVVFAAALMLLAHVGDTIFRELETWDSEPFPYFHDDEG